MSLAAFHRSYAVILLLPAIHCQHSGSTLGICFDFLEVWTAFVYCTQNLSQYHYFRPCNIEKQVQCCDLRNSLWHNNLQYFNICFEHLTAASISHISPRWLLVVCRQGKITGSKMDTILNNFILCQSFIRC